MKEFAVLVFLIVLVSAMIYFGVTGGRVDLSKVPFLQRSSPVEVLHQYDGKIVYTTDTALLHEPFENDCRNRNGIFSTCGTICAPDVIICTQVCAYTCEFED